MKKGKPKCKVCNEFVEGRGHYRFRYLDEEVSLCGHHAQMIMKFIKNLNKIEDDIRNKNAEKHAKFYNQIFM